MLSNVAVDTVKTVMAVPVVTTSGSTGLTYVLGGSPVPIDSGITVTSYDTVIDGASISVANFQSGDSLNFTNQNGITGSYNGSIGTLELSGSATPAQYTAALQSVKFSSTSASKGTRVHRRSSLTKPAPSATCSATSAVDSVKTVDGRARGDDLRQHRANLRARRLARTDRLGYHGNFQRHADLTGAQTSRRQLPVGRFAQFHESERHHRQLHGSIGVLDVERQRHARPIRGGLAVDHVLHHQHTTTTRTIYVQADDINAAVPAPLETDTVKVATAGTASPPVVTTSGSTGQTFNLGGSAVAVDSGITATSSGTDITGASMTIANYQSGDSLNYTPMTASPSPAIPVACST